MEVVIFYDMKTCDVRRHAVEIRSLVELGEGWFASANATLYSCAYETQLERICAFHRARSFADSIGAEILTYQDSNGMKAVWQ